MVNPNDYAEQNKEFTENFKKTYNDLLIIIIISK